MVHMLASAAMAVAAVHFRINAIYYIEYLFLDAGDVINLDKMAPAEAAYLAPVLEEAKNDDVFLGNWYKIISSFIFTIFLMNLTNNMFGVLSIFLKNSVFVWLFILLNCVTAFLEAFSVYMLITPDTKFLDGTSSWMVLLLQKYYELGRHGPFERIVNSVMVLGKCCGIKGPADFHAMIFVNKSLSEFEAKFPPTCCNSTLWKDPLRTYENVGACISRGIVDNDMLYQQGCFKVWDQIFVDNVQKYAIMALITLVILQSIQLIIGFVILKVATFAMGKDDNTKGTMTAATSCNMLAGRGASRYVNRNRSTVLLKKRESTLII